MKDVTRHPDYDPADFEGKCCNGTGLIEINGQVEPCPVCEAVIKKYKDYWREDEPKGKGNGIPF